MEKSSGNQRQEEHDIGPCVDLRPPTIRTPSAPGGPPVTARPETRQPRRDAFDPIAFGPAFLTAFFAAFFAAFFTA